jgi:hypothetical protein
MSVVRLILPIFVFVIADIIRENVCYNNIPWPHVVHHTVKLLALENKISAT